MRTGKFVSKSFVSHAMSRTRTGFRGATTYKKGGMYKTIRQLIQETRDLDRFDDVATLQEKGIFGLVRKLSAEGRSIDT